MFEHFYETELQDSLHGLAPSATNKSLSEAKLMSLWSFWARSPQCISLDFTMATEAAKIYNDLYVYMCFLVNTNKILTEKLQCEKQKSSKYYPHWDCGLNLADLISNALNVLSFSTFILGYHLHPGSWINFHQRIWNKYHMHAIKHTLKQTMIYINSAYFSNREMPERHKSGTGSITESSRNSTYTQYTMPKSNISFEV